MEKKFLKLCSKSIKTNRDRFARDFAVFSKKKNKKTRQILKITRSNTFGNWPIAKGSKLESNTKHNSEHKHLSISQLEQKTKENLLYARKLRRKYDIYLFPESETTPLPIFKFEELSSKLKVNKRICLNLKKWKIRRPLPVQMQVIPIMLKGHELQCCAPTGSGKTIAFIIPILNILQTTIDFDTCDAFCNDIAIDDNHNDNKWSNVKCLIIAPTTVLTHQIYREFIKYAEGLNIGIHLLDENTNNESTPIHIIISTPKPLATLIRNNEIPFNSVECVVLDEADALFDSETAFHVHDIELIISKCNHSHIQRAFFSATLDDKIMNLTQTFLNDPYKISIGHGICGAANVEQHIRFCGDERGKFIELLKIIENGIQLPVLLFVSGNERIIALGKQLKTFQSHLVIDTLHEGLSIQQKNDIVTKFRDESIWFLICNDELSRGMDFLNVQTVINYDFPQTSQQYIHRIGRTGRADRCGTAITFWSDVDNAVLPIVIDVMKRSNQSHRVPEWILRNEKMKRKIKNKQRIVAKLGNTKRGPIRRGGYYVHGTSVLKQNNKKSQNQKRKMKYIKRQRQKKHNKYKRTIKNKEVKENKYKRTIKNRGRGEENKYKRTK